MTAPLITDALVEKAAHVLAAADFYCGAESWEFMDLSDCLDYRTKARAALEAVAADLQPAQREHIARALVIADGWMASANSLDDYDKGGACAAREIANALRGES